jgi:hypothetical protein
MNKLPDDYKDDFREEGLEQGHHLSDDLLLLSIDGELGPREDDQVTEHLKACWSCRARRDRLEESIADVVDYRNALLKPHLPPSKTGRGTFVARLKSYAEEVGRPSLLSRLIGVFRAGMTPPRRATWIGMAAALTVCVLLFVKLQSVPVVSASELLVRARSAETNAEHAVKRPVLYQRVRIRSKKFSVTRTIYRDPIANRILSSDELNESGLSLATATAGLASAKQEGNRAQLETEFQQTLQSVRLDWNAPLSAAGFGRWQETLPSRQDRVLPQGHDFFVLKTTTSYGPVLEGNLTVRVNDFHTVGESFLLQNQDRIEISELSFEVLNLDQIDVTMFAPVTAPTPPAPVRAAKVAVPATPTAPTEAETAEIELQARLVLNRFAADTREQVRVSRSGGQVDVKGVVETEERRVAILAQLAALPHVNSSLLSLEELAANANYQSPVTSVKSYSVSSQSSPLGVYMREKNFAMDDLTRVFQDMLDANLEVQQASATLVDLFDRFPFPGALTEPSRGVRSELIGSYVRTIRTGLDAQEDALGRAGLFSSTPQFGSKEGTVGGAPSVVTVSAQSNGTAETGDSRTMLAKLTAEITVADALCRELIVGEDASRRSAIAIATELRESSERIRALLSSL